eukprot:scaffold14998_cov121-Isochrysis_galbana.AAC.4
MRAREWRASQLITLPRRRLAQPIGGGGLIRVCLRHEAGEAHLGIVERLEELRVPEWREQVGEKDPVCYDGNVRLGTCGQPTEEALGTP